MKLFLPKDTFNNATPPDIFLCTPSGSIMGQLPAYEISGNFKWNTYSEITFSVDRIFTDTITGESSVNTLFDKIEGPRQILVKNVGMFLIQDVDVSYADKDTKNVTCFSAEYNLSTKYLSSFHINTGEVDSKEVIYESSEYYDEDEMYALAHPGKWDANQKYYHRVYVDNDSYNYEQIQITNEDDYKSHFGVDIHPEDILYIHGYANVRFYDPNTPELSLLHLVLENVPGWTIGNVDNVELRYKERKLSEEYINVYDFLTNTVAETFGCVFVFDTINRRIDVYAEENDGLTDDGVINPDWETDVYISKENLASEICVKWSTDNIKTRLKVSGAESLDIREVNLGKNYIMNLDYYRNEDWMEPTLLKAYDDYIKKIDEYSQPYTDAMQGWVEAYNKWNDLMNAVPVEGNVVLVGDEFKKLYCIYGLYSSVKKFTEDTTYYIMNEDGDMSEAAPQPNADNFNEKIYYIKGDYAAKEKELIDQLTSYHVNEDIDASNQDNILLRLKNVANDTATIRIYNASGDKENPVYKIQTLIVRAATGASEAADVRELSEWINGYLHVDKSMAFLKGFKVNYIGIMGAYFVLAKDERELEVLSEYGINLLREKHKTYVTIFQTQTEAMYSQQKYQCIVQNEQPSTKYDIGTKWLDTNSSPVRLYKLSEVVQEGVTVKAWVDTTLDVSADDQKGYENYQRYIDNYEKMIAVQNMLIQKENEAEYWFDGYEVKGRVINNPNDEYEFYVAADAYFNTDGGENIVIIKKEFIVDPIPRYIFTTPKADGEFAVYLNGNKPYITYSESQGIYQAIKNAIAKETELANCFDEEQMIALSPLIREDEYNDDNFLLTGYESEAERLDICKELMEAAAKELKTLSQPSLEFSMTMANILALPEFAPIISKFALGNFIRIELMPGLVKRARLLECNINFDDLSDFSCTFGNLVTTKSEIDLHAELLQQAVTAGKTVAKAAGDWQRAVDKSNKLEQDIAAGLQDAALKVGRASGQAISWDDTGMHFRKYKPGSTTEYEPEEMAIINNSLVATNDSWRTSKAAFGKYTIDGEERWGPVAEYVTADTIEGKLIKGGSIQIGDEDKEGGNLFIVHNDGSVEIKSNGVEKYATKSAMQVIDDAYRYRIDLSYNKSTVFANTNDDCTITCTIYDNRLQKDVTSDFILKGATFSWIRISSGNDEVWNSDEEHINQKTNTITIKRKDIEKNAQFSCQIKINEANLPSDNTQQS